jgi:hypothetical protein
MVLQGFRRFIAAAACIIVGAASFALSFVALRDVAVELQAVPASLGWLVPIAIDGGVICGSAIIWSLSREQRRRPVFPFLFVGALVLVSVVVNAAHAGPSPLAKLIASLPPLILLGTLELVASQGRRMTANSSVSAPATNTTVAAAQPSDRQPALLDTSISAPNHSPITITATHSRQVRTEPAAQHPHVTVEPLVAAAVPAPAPFSDDDIELITSDIVDAAEQELVANASDEVVKKVTNPGSWTRPQDTYTRSVDSSNRRKASRVRAEGPLL